MEKEKIKLDYFYGIESEQYSFYRIPKLLFTHKEFMDISFASKILYGMLLDRMSLSRQNNWKDKDDKVYIFYTIETAQEILGYKKTKITTLFNELIEKGLIEKNKQGFGKPDKIYVKSFVSIMKKQEKENPDDQNMNLCEQEKENFSKTKETNLEKKEQKKGEKGAGSTEKSRQPFNGLLDDRNTNLWTTEIRASRQPKYEPLDDRNTNPNKTNINKTEYSKTDINNTEYNQSFNQSQENNNYQDKIKQTKEQMKRIEIMNEKEIYDYVNKQLLLNKTLPYIFLDYRKILEIAIEILMGEENIDKQDNINKSLNKIFLEAMVDMLYLKNGNMVQKQCIKREEVYDKLIKNIEGEEDLEIIELKNIVLNDFKKAIQTTTIKNHLGYMKSCIWTSLKKGNIEEQALIYRDFKEE